MKFAGRLATFVALAFHLGTVQSVQAASPAAAAADFSGTWLPDARRAEPWPSDLPLTATARRFMEKFEAAQSDPTTFCMPFGTPRNMLQTGYPLEIVQTPQRVVMVIQPILANAEVRRIPLDAGPLPEAPEPSWFGISRGRWEGATLVIETIGMREDAILSDNGLPHSGQLRVVERLRLERDPERGKVLVDDIELHDPQAWQGTLKTRRYFSWAPDARPRDPTCVDALWTEKLWSERLREHALQAAPAEATP